MKLRKAATPKERLEAALNSSDDDLFKCDKSCSIIVTGVSAGGDRIYLGEIPITSFCMTHADPSKLIDRVRFGVR